MQQANRSRTPHPARRMRLQVSQGVANLDDWLYAIAFVILQRQMRSHWAH